MLEALHEAGLFRLLLPQSLNGGEADPLTFVRVTREIAKADASTAWCLCQAVVCSMAAAYLAPDLAREVFGDPRAILCWGPPARVEATAVPGGCRVSGTFTFASGGRHATWLGAACPSYDADGVQRRRSDGSPEVRTLLVPASEVTWSDVWQVIGLKGTGSDSYAIQDAFVPNELVVLRDEPSERRESNLVYRFSTYTMFAVGFAGVAIGIARSSLDAFVQLAAGKTPRALQKMLRDNPVVQSQVGQAEARLRAAETFLLRSLEEVWRDLDGELTLEQRVLLRMAASHALKETKEVVDTAYYLAGSSAIFQSAPFERRFRDMNTVRQQLQGRLDHFERVGQFLLGLEPDTLFL